MMALGTFLAIQRTLQSVDSEFPLQYAICLAEMALTPGISLTGLAERCNMPLSTVSRIVGALSHKRQKGQPYELVRVEISPEERRRKQLYLTETGQALVCSLIKATDCKPADVALRA